MSKSDTFENDLLKLIFNGVSIANLADNAASSPLTNLYVAFHTADPTDAGVQTANEASYTGYARAAVPRTTGGWLVTGNSVSPVAAIYAPGSTGGSATPLTHFSIGTLASGAGKILYKGALSASITMGAGVIPGLSTATTITED